MKKFLAALFLIAGFLITADAASHVQFQFADPQFGVSTTTNRLVTLQGETGYQVNQANVLLPFRVQGYTDTNGSIIFSNIYGSAISGWYHWTMPAPPQKAEGDIWVQSTNLGLVQASTILGNFGASTYPAANFAWSAQVSDARYSQGTNTIVRADLQAAGAGIVVNNGGSSVLGTGTTLSLTNIPQNLVSNLSNDLGNKQPASANLTNWASTGLFNTNGLASTNYANGLTNGLTALAYANPTGVQPSSANLTNWSGVALFNTNGLANTNFVVSATNGITPTAYKPLGLFITNVVAGSNATVQIANGVATVNSTATGGSGSTNSVSAGNSLVTVVTNGVNYSVSAVSQTNGVAFTNQLLALVSPVQNTITFLNGSTNLQSSGVIWDGTAATIKKLDGTTAFSASTNGILYSGVINAPNDGSGTMAIATNANVLLGNFNMASGTFSIRGVVSVQSDSGGNNIVYAPSATATFSNIIVNSSGLSSIPLAAITPQPVTNNQQSVSLGNEAVTNLSFGPNLILNRSTNVIQLTGFGDSIANGGYAQTSQKGYWTNYNGQGYYLYNNGSGYSLFSGSGSLRYSTAAIEDKAWSINNGAGPQGTSMYGAELNGSGINILGWVNSTNLQTYFANSTNFTLSIGLNDTNYANAVGLADTNNIIALGTASTNNVMVASNHLYASIVAATNGLSGGGGSATNAISNNNGYGTNTTIVGQLVATNIYTAYINQGASLGIASASSSQSSGSQTATIASEYGNTSVGGGGGIDQAIIASSGTSSGPNVMGAGGQRGSSIISGFSSTNYGSQSVAMGALVTISNYNNLVWNDGNGRFKDYTNYTVLLNAKNGVAINTNNPSGNALMVLGTVNSTAGFVGNGSGLTNLNFSGNGAGLTNLTSYYTYVDAFGATNDGATDSTLAISNAVQSYIVTRKPLWFSACNSNHWYVVHDSFIFDAKQIQQIDPWNHGVGSVNNVWIEGANSRILTTANKPIFIFTNALNNVVIHGIELDGSYATNGAAPGIAIYTDSSGNSPDEYDFQQVTVQGFGIGLFSESGSTLTLDHCALQYNWQAFQMVNTNINTGASVSGNNNVSITKSFIGENANGGYFLGGSLYWKNNEGGNGQTNLVTMDSTSGGDITFEGGNQELWYGAAANVIGANPSSILISEKEFVLGNFNTNQTVTVYNVYSTSATNAGPRVHIDNSIYNSSLFSLDNSLQHNFQCDQGSVGVIGTNASIAGQMNGGTWFTNYFGKGFEEMASLGVNYSGPQVAAIENRFGEKYGYDSKYRTHLFFGAVSNFGINQVVYYNDLTRYAYDAQDGVAALTTASNNWSASQTFQATSSSVYPSIYCNGHSGLYFVNPSITTFGLAEGVFGQDDFAVSASTSRGAIQDPSSTAQPLLYINKAGNLTTIGHTAATQPSGNSTLTVEGTLTATGVITGNGSGLTNLNASNLASGSVPDAQLGSAALTNRANTFTAAQTFNGNTSATNALSITVSNTVISGGTGGWMLYMTNSGPTIRMADSANQATLVLAGSTTTLSSSAGNLALSAGNQVLDIKNNNLTGVNLLWTGDRCQQLSALTNRAGYLIVTNGIASYATNATSGICLNTSATAITNKLTSANVKVLFTMTAGTFGAFNSSGFYEGGQSTVTETTMWILQPGGYLTNSSGTLAVNAVGAF